MMKRFRKKVCTVIVIMMFVTLALSGCSQEKNITLSDDVKNQEKSKEVANNLERLKQLNIDEKKYYLPIYWKDDNNVIAINNETTEFNYGFYNINLENSEVTRINEISAVVVSNEITKGLNNKNILLIKDKKLLLYDAENNAVREIYNLDKVAQEIETEYKKFENDSDFIGKCHFEIVSGSNKYVSIIARKQCDGYHYDYIKILDLETNKVTEVSPKEDLALDSAFYSKLTNKFYVSSPSERVYSFSLEGPEDFKEAIKIPRADHYSWTMDEKGEFVYSNTYTEKSEIMKYDVKKNTVSKVEGTDFISNNESDERIYNINLRGKLISYRTYSYKNKNSNLYVGSLSENKINTFGKIKMEKTKDENNIFTSLVNEKGDKMITGNCYYSSEKDSRYVYTVEKISNK